MLPEPGLRWSATAGCNQLPQFWQSAKPEIMWQFSEVIDGMADACRVFETPVTGGNVSLYNEILGEGIYPTPLSALWV
jgi:phosphoribosylformylglycinamidine synthase